MTGERCVEAESGHQVPSIPISQDQEYKLGSITHEMLKSGKSHEPGWVRGDHACHRFHHIASGLRWNQLSRTGTFPPAGHG